MVRLVFRPYAQVGRSICTSESLRASTRVSPGFALLRRRSPSIGSRHLYSCSGNTANADNHRADDAPFSRQRERSRLKYAFTTPWGFVQKPCGSHRCRTPWSVFQDGSGGYRTDAVHIATERERQTGPSRPRRTPPRKRKSRPAERARAHRRAHTPVVDHGAAPLSFDNAPTPTGSTTRRKAKRRDDAAPVTAEVRRGLDKPCRRHRVLGRQ